LVNETLFNLASGQDAGQPRQLEAGQPLTWTGGGVVGASAGGGGTPSIDSVQLICPDTSTRTLNPELRGGRYFVEDRNTALPASTKCASPHPPKPAPPPRPPSSSASTSTPTNSTPALLDPSDLAWLKGHDYLKGLIGNAGVPPAASADARSGIEPPAAPATAQAPLTLAQALEATRGGLDLWPSLALALLLLLVLEVALTFFLVRQQAGKTLEEDNLQTVMPKSAVQRGNA